MPYRSNVWTESRLLVVRNYPRLTAIAAICIGALVAILGCILSPITQLLRAPGGEVVMSATGTVFVLAGVTIAVLGVRMRRSRTLLALDHAQLTVICAGEARDRHVIQVQDIERVGVEIADDGKGPTYRTQIVVRGAPAIALGELMTSSRPHYERVAADIRRFLDGP